MRVLLVTAVAGVAVAAVLVWARGESGHGCRAPASGPRAARAMDRSATDAEPIAFGPGGPIPGAESGTCTLRLRLWDRATGEPFASRVDLWRLDLPEDESWTAGDQYWTSTQVAADGIALTHLPAGLYRVAVHGQSYLATDDPPAFRVRDACTDIDLAVRAPRSHRVFLRVFDEGAHELRTGWLQRRNETTTRELGDPDWTRRHRWKRASPSATRNGPIGVRGGPRVDGDGYGDTRWTAAGFDLGPFLEDSRTQRRTTRLSLSVPEHSTVLMEVGGRLTGDCRYVAVAVSLAELEDLVFLPDGRRAADAGALFEAKSSAVQVEPSDPGDIWRRQPVRVRVALAGYAMLTFDYRVDQPARRFMRRRSYG